MTRETLIVLFDGGCALCNGLVRWILRRDKRRKISLMPLQSPDGALLLGVHSLNENHFGDTRETTVNLPSSLVVVHRGRIWTKSDGALEIARALGGPWKLFRVIRWIPRFIRDGLYDWVARNRFRWFGSATSCELPFTPALPEETASKNHPGEPPVRIHMP